MKYLTSTSFVVDDAESAIPRNTRALEANTGVDQALRKEVAGIRPVGENDKRLWNGENAREMSCIRQKDACLSITKRRG